MNKKNKYILIGTLTLLILISGYFSLKSVCSAEYPWTQSCVNQNTLERTLSQADDPRREIFQQENIRDESKSILLHKEALTEKPTESDTPPTKETLVTPPSLPNPEDIQASLVILDKKYNTNIKKDSSVFNVMKKIKSESKPDNPFDFKYTEYSGLGSFINEINGTKGSSGKYWIYYVNNKEASVGVSNYIIKSGDIISWKQE